MSTTQDSGSRAWPSGPRVNVNTLRTDKSLTEQILGEMRLHHGFKYEDCEVFYHRGCDWPFAVLAKLNDGREVLHSIQYVPQGFA